MSDGAGELVEERTRKIVRGLHLKPQQACLKRRPRPWPGLARLHKTPVSLQGEVATKSLMEGGDDGGICGTTSQGTLVGLVGRRHGFQAYENVPGPEHRSPGLPG